MLTTIALTLVLSCKRAPHPEPVVQPVRPSVVSSCEGADRVERTAEGYEYRRFVNQCTVVPRPKPDHRQDALRFGLTSR